MKLDNDYIRRSLEIKAAESYIYNIKSWEIDKIPEQFREAYEAGNDRGWDDCWGKSDMNYILPYDESDERVFYWIKGYEQACNNF